MPTEVWKQFHDMRSTPSAPTRQLHPSPVSGPASRGRDEASPGRIEASNKRVEPSSGRVDASITRIEPSIGRVEPSVTRVEPSTIGPRGSVGVNERDEHPRLPVTNNHDHDTTKLSLTMRQS